MTFSWPLFYRRVLALVILAAVLMATWQLLAVPGVKLLSYKSDDIELAHRRLLKIQTHAILLKGLKSQLTSLTNANQHEEKYIEGQTASAAAAVLQTMIRQIVVQDGGTVSSINILPASSPAGLSQISIHVTIKLPIRQLADFLYAVESNTPSIFIDRIKIQNTDDTIDSAAATNEKMLLLELDISAFYHEPSRS